MDDLAVFTASTLSDITYFANSHITSIYKYLQVFTSIYQYLQVFTSIYKYLPVFHLEVFSNHFLVAFVISMIV